MKKFFYPAIFHAAEEGGYWVTFPDIPECITEGDDMEEAYQMAVDALGLALTERMKEGEKLPVAFWIHGGGFSGGYGSELEFDGEAFCKKRVILVTINYRVNIFGFFAHPWLDAENERHISGNYGILDQIAALKWVHNNIENFGGDNKNITVSYLFSDSSRYTLTPSLIPNGHTPPGACPI